MSPPNRAEPAHASVLLAPRGKAATASPQTRRADLPARRVVERFAEVVLRQPPNREGRGRGGILARSRDRVRYFQPMVQFFRIRLPGSSNGPRLNCTLARVSGFQTPCLLSTKERTCAIKGESLSATYRPG